MSSFNTSNVSSQNKASAIDRIVKYHQDCSSRAIYKLLKYNRIAEGHSVESISKYMMDFNEYAMSVSYENRLHHVDQQSQANIEFVSRWFVEHAMKVTFIKYEPNPPSDIKNPKILTYTMLPFEANAKKSDIDTSTFIKLKGVFYWSGVPANSGMTCGHYTALRNSVKQNTEKVIETLAAKGTIREYELADEAVYDDSKSHVSAAFSAAHMAAYKSFDSANVSQGNFYTKSNAPSTVRSHVSSASSTASNATVKKHPRQETTGSVPPPPPDVDFDKVFKKVLSNTNKNISGNSNVDKKVDNSKPIEIEVDEEPRLAKLTKSSPPTEVSRGSSVRKITEAFNTAASGGNVNNASKVSQNSVNVSQAKVQNSTISRGSSVRKVAEAFNNTTPSIHSIHRVAPKTISMAYNDIVPQVTKVMNNDNGQIVENIYTPQASMYENGLPITQVNPYAVPHQQQPGQLFETPANTIHPHTYIAKQVNIFGLNEQSAAIIGEMLRNDSVVKTNVNVVAYENYGQPLNDGRKYTREQMKQFNSRVL